MLKRIRRLRISLAAKCRILFGAAVALIIGAALYVPWQRMEQLTEQLDRGAAAALAEQAIREHLWAHGRRVASTTSDGPATRTVTAPAAVPDGPGATAGDELSARLVESSPAPRLISAETPPTAQGLTALERKAIRRHRAGAEPDRVWFVAYYQRPDGTEGYRYVHTLSRAAQCAGCHAAPATAPATSPATAPAGAPLAAASASGPSGAPPPPPTSPFEPGPVLGFVSVDMPSRIDANQLLLNRVFIFTAGLLAGTLAVIAFYLITTRLILQPVRVLQETAEKVSEGDLNIRSDISTGDEFQQLSQTFNVMLANLKESQDQLRSINKSLDLKLGQLAESNLALYESNRLKSEFLANVSHELRTPLNSILGFADLLKDAAARESRAGADGKAARYVNNILQSGRHLLDLINDLLDLAKIEAGKMEIRSEPLSLGDLFEGLANILKPLLEQKDLVLMTAVAPGVPIVHSDPGKLQQVLYNFLSNAIKFSPAGSRIDLSATRDDEEHVRVAVADRGPGIAPEHQKVIFEKFRQLDAGVTRTHGGTGLGLSISKELVTLLGGSIGVRSTPGEGATFWVALPLRIAAGAMDVRSRLVLT